MSTKLGTLTLDLVAKIGNFVEPMNQAEKKAKGTSQTIADSFNVSAFAVNALGAAFAGVTVGGLAAFTNQVINTGNEIKKLSQLSNTSTFDFQFYAKGAETAGISMESFADKMKDMQDRIGDFQQTGGGPLADFFTNIAPLVGVTIEQFQKLSGPEALQLFYNSLEKVGATQNDMKFYMESIISDSSLLIPLLENGGEGFKKWGQAASDAGAIMSNEMIEKLALAKENMQMLNLQVEGVQVSLINGLAPVVQTVANNLDVVAVAMGTVAVVMTAKATPAFVMGTIEATRYQLALARMSAQAAGTTTTLTVLGGVARGALGLLGGPVGLALTVAATAGAYLLFRDNTKESTVSLRENNETVEQAIQKYSELDKIKRAAQLVEEREKLEELSTSYEDANSKLIAYTLNVVRGSDMTSEQASKFSDLVMGYKSGKITLEQLSDAVSKSTSLSKDEKDAFIKKAASVRDASTEVNKHKNLISQMIERDKQLIKTNDDVTNSIDRRGAALLKLTQKEREVYNSIGQEVERENYINANVSRGLMSRDQAEYFADKRAEAGIPYSKLLSKEMYIQIEQGYKLQQQTKKREDTEKKIADEQKKRADFAEKNYSYTKSELVMLERVAKISASNNLNGIGAKYGIPENLLAAVMAQESKGVINAKSPTGAIGPFQTTGIYRQQYDLSVADSYDVRKSAEVAAKDLAKSFEVFGNWKDAITAYNAGISGTKNLNKKGFTGSNAKTKEASNYAPMVDKWFTALNGSSLKNSGLTGKEAVLSIKELGEYWENAEELRKQSLERQSNVDKLYLNEEQMLFVENEEAKKEIREAFAGNPEAVEKYLVLQQAAYEKDVAEYHQAQKQKELSDKKQLLEAKSNWMSAGEYAQEYYALVREEILNTPSYSPEMKDALLQQANYQQNTEQAGESDQAIADYRDVMGYEESPLIKQYEVLDKMRKLDLVNEEKYQQDKLKLQALSTASYMEGMIGGFASLVDENSKTYAVLFAAQKAFAVAQAMLNIPAAYSKAYDAVVGTPYIGPYIAPAVGAAAAALQVAQAASIKGVGYADGGFTGHGGKYEPAGIVHKGEGVLTQEEIAALGGPSGFYALRQSIKNGFADGGLVMDAPKVLNPSQNPDVKKAMNQVQSNIGQPQVNLNPNFVIVDEREKLGDYLFGPDGKKAMVKFFKQNRRELGIA